MIFPIESFATEHIVVLVTGVISLVAGLLLRGYGRRHERRTGARGQRLID